MAFIATGQAQVLQIRATKIEHAPKLNADPNDPDWKDCPVATSFKDGFTAQPVPDQTEARIAYDDEALYVLFVCHDARPDQIVGREIEPESEFKGEDTVTLTIDPYNTHSGSSISHFTVNAINTRSEGIAGGHSSKAEWRGIWQSWTKRFTGGYIVEMRIPWRILSYPTLGRPIDMDLNFDRYQARTKTGSQWAYVTHSFDSQLLGHLQAIQPPAQDSRSRWQFLAYDAPQDEKGLFSNRIGVDARYAVSNEQTALLSVSPDFLNIEQQIAGVSFVHTERFLNDARPFFTEGRDFFNPIGEFEYGIPFYSQRIGLINVGSKFFGQLSPSSKLGALAVEQSDGSTATFSNIQLNPSPTFSQSIYASTYVLGNTKDFLSGISTFKKWGNWFSKFSGAIDSKNNVTDSAGNLSAGFRGPKLLSEFQGIWVDTSFNPTLGYTPWQDRRGFYTYSEYTDTLPSGPFHDWNASLYTPDFYQSGGIIQERGLQAGLNLTTRADQNISINRTFTDYQTGTDDFWDVSYGVNASNRFKQASIEYQFGTQNSTPSKYVDLKGSLRVLRSMDLGIEQSILTFSPSARQTVASIGWQIDSRRSITGRFVQTNGDQNFFLSFKNAGGTGAETYLIIGDPNAVTFTKRIALKFVWAF
jgi:hypothetical protein